MYRTDILPLGAKTHQKTDLFTRSSFDKISACAAMALDGQAGATGYARP